MGRSPFMNLVVLHQSGVVFPILQVLYIYSTLYTVHDRASKRLYSLETESATRGANHTRAASRARTSRPRTQQLKQLQAMSEERLASTLEGTACYRARRCNRLQCKANQRGLDPQVRSGTGASVELAHRPRARRRGRRMGVPGSPLWHAGTAERAYTGAVGSARAQTAHCSARQ